MKIQEKLKNKNFRNNQNYIIDYEDEIIKKRVICYLGVELKKKKIGYIENGFVFKYNLLNPFVILGITFFPLVFIKIYNGTIEKSDFFVIFLLVTPGFLKYVFMFYYMKKLLKKHIIFKKKFNDNKIYLYRFRK